MSNIPANLKYSKSHEWILEEDGVFTIGMTDYAQSALGDIVFINLPEEGDSVTAGESFSDVESVKAGLRRVLPRHRHGDCGERGAAGRSRPGERGPL